MRSLEIYPAAFFCMDMQGKISDHYGNAVIAKSANYMINL